MYQGKPAIQGVLIDITSRVEAEERFRSLSEASREAIFISEKGICFEQNLAAENLFGYTLEEAVGKPGTDWVVAEDRDTVMQNMLSGYEKPYVVNALRKDGSRFPCEIVGRMMEYKGRKVRVTVLRDITDQIQAEEELRESEEKYRNIVENSLEGMFRSTFDGRFLMANPALARIYGYDSPEELIAEITDIREQLYVQGEVRDVLINSLMEEKELIDIVEENRRKDGSLIWISTKARIVRDAAGEPLYIEGFVEDITERLETSRALQERERKLKEAQKIGKMGHWELDLRTNRLFWSDEIFRMFEVDPEASVSTFEAFMEKIHPEDREMVGNAYADSLQSNVPYDIVHRILLNDNSVRYVRERCETEYDPTGEPLRSLGTVQDVTEQVQDEQILEVRVQLAEYSLTHSVDELLRKTLDEAEKLTDSKIGFYHFVDEDQNTIALQTWSTRTEADYCSIPNLERHYPIEQAGIWTDCIHTRKPVIHNDYSSVKYKKALPEGHAELIRQLVVPVLRQNKVVAILGIGNKPNDYHERDVEIISTLAELCWEVTERKLAEKALSESEERLRSLINATPDIICFKDGQGRWLTANDADLQLFELEDVNYVGKTDSELAEHSDFYRDAFLTCEDTDEIAWQAGGISRGNEVIPTPSQGDKVYDVIKVPVFNDDGSRQGLVVLGRDITKQVAAQTSLEKHSRQLEIVNKISSALSTSLAFEDVLDVILQQVVQVIECDSAAIFLTGENEMLTLVKAVGEAVQFEGHSMLLGETLMCGIEEGQNSLILDDAIKSPHFKKWNRPSSIRGWLGLQLYTRDILVGYLTFDNRLPQAYDSRDAALAESFAPQIAQAIYNARLHREVKQHLQQFQTLNTVTAALSTSLELESLLELIFDQIGAVLPLDSGAVFLHENGKLRVAVDRGIVPSLRGQFFSDEDELFKEIQRSGEPLVIKDVKKDSRLHNWGKSDNLASWMGVPLLVRDELIGFLTLDSHKGDILYSKEQALLVKPFAAQAAQAIYNARLYERVIADANDLEKHVQQRTEELQNFVELTADREIRMVELKETIRKLRTQLLEAGQAPVADDPLSSLGNAQKDR